ncbi:hypothetical protein H4R33_007107, partial [Dimargaris cristalligena]
MHHQSGDLTMSEQCGLLDIYKWGQIDSEGRLFNSFVVYDNFPPAMSNITNSQITLESRDGQNFTEYAYTVRFADSGENLELYLVYETVHCDEIYARLLARFIDHFLTLMVRSPSLTLRELVGLPTDEAKLVHTWARGPVLEFTQRHWLAHQLFTEHSTSQPGAIALESSNRRYTYTEVYHRAKCVAQALRQHGLQSGDFVALLFPRSVEFIFSYLGVLLAGGVCAPLDPTNAIDRLRYTLGLLDSPWTITDTAHQSIALDNLGVAKLRLLLFDNINCERQDTSGFQPDSTRLSTDLMYMLFTSGTTGRPKGVPIRHESLVNYILANDLDLQLDSSTRMLQAMNISFDVCISEIFAVFHAGGTLVLQDGDLLDTLKRVNTCCLVPSILAALNPSDFPNLTQVVATGDALPVQVARRWCTRVRLFNKYGPTEATIHSHSSLVQIDEPNTIGRPLANYTCYIVDDNLCPVPIGVPGELCLGGIGISSGYWRQPELTTQAFVLNPFGPGNLYRTGDLVSWLPNGLLYYIGRKDFQVKLRGYRIELSEIENTASSMEGVANAVACVTQQQI